jgi:hypothetical protein
MEMGTVQYWTREFVNGEGKRTAVGEINVDK